MYYNVYILQFYAQRICKFVMERGCGIFALGGTLFLARTAPQNLQTYIIEYTHLCSFTPLDCVIHIGMHAAARVVTFNIKELSVAGLLCCYVRHY